MGPQVHSTWWKPMPTTILMQVCIYMIHTLHSDAFESILQWIDTTVVVEQCDA